MAKKAPDRIRDGETSLLEAGVGAAASVEQLAAALGGGADVDLAIVHRLGGISSQESADLLRRIEKEGTGGAAASKDLRKEIKRSLYRLEQRGVAVPKAEAAPRRAASAPGIEGYVSAFDGRGDRLVWLVKPRPGSVLHLFAVVNDPQGLREVAANQISRKALREIQEELRSKHDIRLVDVDWRWADYAVHRALEWARAGGRPVQGDYPGLRVQMTGEPVRTDLPGPLALLAADVAVEERHLVDCAEILLEPEMRTWQLAEEIAGKAIDELVEIRDSPLVLNEAQVTERFDAVTGRIVDEVFGGEARASWQRRLEEMAYYFAKTGRPERASQSAAAARALGEGRPPAEIPFCVVYVRRTLGLYMAEAQKREEESRQSSLVVTPEQARRQRPIQRPKRK